MSACGLPVRRPYAAPELVAARDWGPEADRYAVAAIAYELLTGRRATGSGDEIIERLGSVYVGDEGALPALKDAFAWGLAEEPADRPGHAAEFVTALAEALGVEVVELEPLPASAPEDDPLASEPLAVPAPSLGPAGAGSPPIASFEGQEPDRESSATGREGGEEPPGPVPLPANAAEATDEAGPELPASLRGGGPDHAPTGAPPGRRTRRSRQTRAAASSRGRRHARRAARSRSTTSCRSTTSSRSRTRSRSPWAGGSAPPCRPPPR